VIQNQPLRTRLHVVQHAVEPRGERVDVFAVERRDERRVQVLDEFVCDQIGLMFRSLIVAAFA
jgi:hypothetical protein